MHSLIHTRGHQLPLQLCHVTHRLHVLVQCCGSLRLSSSLLGLQLCVQLLPLKVHVGSEILQLLLGLQLDTLPLEVSIGFKPVPARHSLRYAMACTLLRMMHSDCRMQANSLLVYLCQLLCLLGEQLLGVPACS